MKKINTIYISIILLLSFFIITLNFLFLPHSKQETIPVTNIINGNKIAYLTFDDGPSENTDKILEILEKYQIKATFFVIGPSYKLKNDLLKKIVKQGHNLAIHSYTHEYSQIYANEKAYLDDFYKCVNWIKNITGISPTLYRFPGGSSTTITSKKQIQSIISTLYDNNYKHVDWNVDSYDSHYNNDAKAIINSTINCIKINEGNNIYTQTILMHDNTKKVGTIKALPTIIEYCISKGYTFKLLTSSSKLIQHVKRPT